MRLIHCAECGRNKRHEAHGLCKRCYNRRWREANRDRVRECHRQWYEANRDRARENGRRWQGANPGKACEKSRRWREANPGKVREKDHRRRARKKGATIGPVDEAAIHERDKVCIYCGSDQDLTIDHLIPLARGGPHCQDNLAVACRRCNSSKGTKTYEEFTIEKPPVLT